MTTEEKDALRAKIYDSLLPILTRGYRGVGKIVIRGIANVVVTMVNNTVERR